MASPLIFQISGRPTMMVLEGLPAEPLVSRCALSWATAPWDRFRDLLTQINEAGSGSTTDLLLPWFDPHQGC